MPETEARAKRLFWFPRLIRNAEYGSTAVFICGNQSLSALATESYFSGCSRLLKNLNDFVQGKKRTIGER